MLTGSFGQRFICLTFDDGYRDIINWAYPILMRHRAPFAVYVPTSFPDRRGHLWWLTLEAALAASEHIELTSDQGTHMFQRRTPQEKDSAFHSINQALCAVSIDDRLNSSVEELARRGGISPASQRAEVCMSWKELAELAADPLVTIGAHSVNHLNLRKACDASARVPHWGAREVLRSLVDIAVARGLWLANN